MKYREIIPAWLEYKKQYVKLSTMSAYKLLIDNHLIPEFGDLEFITEAQVQRFVLQKLEIGLSQKSITDVLICLKMTVKFGKKQRLFDYDEWEVIYPSNSKKNTKLEVLTKAEHKKILDYIVSNFNFKNLGIYICLCTGIRIGEVCGLTWEDINLEDQIIYVRRTIQRIYSAEPGNKKKTQLIIDTPKTQTSRREIPMAPDLVKMVKNIKKLVNDSYYVISNDKKPIEPRTYRCYYKLLMKELDMPSLKFHGLRHTFATRCIESRADIKTVSTILGHANITTTLNIYVHPNNEQKKKVIDQMFKSIGK